MKESRIFSHGHNTIGDVQDVLTDENGEFVFEGYKGDPPGLSEELGKPIFTIFKPGYWLYGHGGLPKNQSLELRPWKPGEERERRLRVGEPPSACYGDSPRMAPHLKDKNNCPNMFRLVNLDRKTLGLTGEIGRIEKGENK